MKVLSSFLFLFCFLLITGCGDDDEDMVRMRMFSRADYLGSYSVAEVCPGGQRSYTSTLTAGNGSDVVFISNLLDLGEDVGATVLNEKLTIPMQRVPSFRVYTGSGTLTEDELTINFTVTGSSGSSDCRAVFTPQ